VLRISRLTRIVLWIILSQCCLDFWILMIFPATEMSEIDFNVFFVAQEANFMNRRARIMARFQQNRRLLLDVDSEFEDSEDEDNLVDGEAADRDQEVPIQLYPEVNHEGHCPVCWLQVPNTIITPCGEIFCLMCVETLEGSRATTCPVCRSRFNGHRPVPENPLTKRL
jgi:hypothetical protein